MRADDQPGRVGPGKSEEKKAAPAPAPKTAPTPTPKLETKKEETKKEETKKELPKTGGNGAASLFAFAGGALLVSGGLLVRQIVR